MPGNAADKLAKAAGRGADALIVDLEDAVPLAMKDDARAAVVAWLRAGPPTLPVWVRVNQGPARDPDLRALAGLSGLDGVPALAGVVLAKALDAADVASAAAVLAAARRPGDAADAVAGDGRRHLGRPGDRASATRARSCRSARSTSPASWA